MQPLGAGEVEERLVDRQRLDQRRQRQHPLAHRAADLDIFRHVRLDDGGVRAELQRLEHRHRRADAVGARDVAAGRDHAALAAADDQRLVGESWVVALLDRGVEGVAVDMGDRQRRRVRRGARGAASRRPGSAFAASAASVRQSRQNAVTESRAPRASPPSALLRSGRCRPGRMPASAVKAAANCSSTRDRSSTPARNPVSPAASRISVRPDAGHGQETAEPLRLRGNDR